LATALRPAFDSAARRRGLLGLDRLEPGQALILAPTNAIHTFFMNFAIDAVFVRRDGRVLKTVNAMAPGRLSAAWRGFAVVELPADAIGRSLTMPGDLLRPVRTDASADFLDPGTPDFRLAPPR
jgi:uncharacterized membrane protein (UPF0127 family)